MSSKPAAGRSVPRMLVAAAVSAAALFAVVKGVEQAAYALGTAGLDGVVALPYAPNLDRAPLVAAQDAAAAWRDVPGLRDRARLAYRVGERALALPDAATSIAESAAVVEVDPANGWAWLDIARSARPMADRAALADAAFTLSVLTAPWEETTMRQRISFVLDIWASATDEEKRRGAQDIANLRRDSPVRFAAELPGLLAVLTPATRGQVVAAIRQHDPSFTP